MEDSLQEIEIENEGQTNFKKWAFRLFIDLIFSQALIFYHISTSDFPQRLVILIFSILSWIFFIGGSLFLILSIVKKEEKNYQYWIALLGFSLYLILTIAFSSTNLPK